MEIHKQVLRETLAQYQAWNEQKTLNQILQDRARTSEEKWLAYQDLFGFAIRVQPRSRTWAEMIAAEDWATYYKLIQQFEARRQQRGKTA